MIEILKGMKDRMDLEAKKMEFIYKTSDEIFKSYGYEKIFTPMLEATELYKRGVGDETDIVSKEMYEFIDKGGRNITLRPEGTAGVVRAYLESGRHKSNPQLKTYYQGPMFRYEAPQKGRYREFNQIGVECFGISDPLIDAEIIQMGIEFLEKIGVDDTIVEINNIGMPEDRKYYIKALVEYLSNHYDNLTNDSKRRLKTNPLRILDTKDEKELKILENAPKLEDYISNENKEVFSKILKYLDIMNISYKINPYLVRGLDYYVQTVFEIKSSKLGAQSTVLGGGRYDKLLNILGNVDIPAIGFAIGVERSILLLDDKIFENYIKEQESKKYYAIYNENTREYMLKCINILRKKGYDIEYDYSLKSFSNQMKKANKLNYDKVLIFGEDEQNNETISIKDFKSKEQKNIKMSEMEKNV